jgi:polyadenylate-binding protein
MVIVGTQSQINAASRRSPPGGGCIQKEKFSLWVGNIDKDVSERELYQIFSMVGPVSSVRVCTDAVSRRSLGYAYINFVDGTVAQEAIETKSYEEVRGHPMQIMWSQRDPRIRRSGIGNIFVNNLDKSVDAKSLRATFSQFGSILSCKVATEPDGSSKGYGFVHFDRVQSAKECIEQVNGKEIEGKVVIVRPFLPRSERPANKETDFTNLFVKNLPESVDDEKLFALFNSYGSIKSATIMRSSSGSSKCFGFVDFSAPHEAHEAVAEMDGYEIDRQKIVVCRAQKRFERASMLTRLFEERKNERIAEHDGMNLYVKYLPNDYNDAKLRELFSYFGTITSCKVMMDEKTTHAKGFGFVCFSTAEEAQTALTEMQNKIIAGKPLYVSLAQRKEVRRQQLEMQFRMRSFNRQKGTDASIIRNRGHPWSDSSPNSVHNEIRCNNTNMRRGNLRRGLPMVRKPSATCDLSSVLASLLEEQRKHRIGQELYPLIYKYQPELAGKITGMFLEMEIGELLGMLENPAQLVENIREAIHVLQEGEAIPEGINIHNI